MEPIIRAMLVSLLIFTIAIETVSRKALDDPTKNTSEIEIKTVHVGNIDMAYKTIGQGQPLIMITGSGSTMDPWPPEVLCSLSSEYKVVIFDNRGMGHTTAPPGNFSIVQFADDTAGLMDALGIKKANVLGWSMGSFIAQELALNHPDKVDKLVLYAGDPGGPQAIPPSTEVIKELTDTSGGPSDRGMRLFSLQFPEEWLEGHPGFYKQFPIPKETSIPENIARQSEAIERWRGTYDRLSNLRAPALIIVGTQDRIAPPENSLILAERIPDSWLIRFKGAGHGLIYQYPDEFSRIVMDFFDL